MKKLLILMCLLIVWTACKHERPPATTGSVCFSTEILPVFVSNCAKSGCHDASAAEGVRLDSYEAILQSDDAIVPFNTGKSEVIEAILDNDPDKMMPPPGHNPLSQSQIDRIIAWVKEGAPNTTNCGNSGCDSTQFTYQLHVKPIIDGQCLGCHSGNTPSGNLNLSTHAALAGIALSGTLAGVIDHANGFTAMPPTPQPIDPCLRAVLKNWAAAGAPDN